MRSTLDRLISWIGLALAAVLLVAGGMLTWASSFINSNVEQQLTDQDITMPVEAAMEGLSQVDKDALMLVPIVFLVLPSVVLVAVFPGVLALRLHFERASLAAVEGAFRQARALPNPDLSFEIEDFGGNLPSDTPSQSTLSIGQRVEWFGKRSARVEAAPLSR